VELFPGVRLTLDFTDSTHRSTYWRGRRFEAPTPTVLLEWTDAPDAVFFDVGANYGFYSYLVAAYRPAVRVYAFEPHPGNVRLLEETRQRNRLDRLHVVGAGLSDTRETGWLRHGTEDQGHSTFTAHPDLENSARSQARLITFDAWRGEARLALPSRPAWVAKIDVEGYELRVLRGMRQALQARAFRGLVVEINDFTLRLAGTTAAEIYDLLAQAGYRPWQDPRVARARRAGKTLNAFFTLSEQVQGSPAG
jgi:FkbM family methyltransferase